jgi:rare lipoprotein A
MNSLSAAHPTLPLPSYVRVTNLENRRSVVVRVNDRGPYHDNRVIDVSVRAAKILGFYERGVANVRVEYVGRASLNGSDDEKLAQSLRTNEPVAPVVRVAASAPVFVPAAQAAPAMPQTMVTAYAPHTDHGAALFGRGLY